MEGSPNHSIMFIMAHIETQKAIIGRNKETNEIFCCALNEVKYYNFNIFSFFVTDLLQSFPKLISNCLVSKLGGHPINLICDR